MSYKWSYGKSVERCNETFLLLAVTSNVGCQLNLKKKKKLYKETETGQCREEGQDRGKWPPWTILVSISFLYLIGIYYHVTVQRFQALCRHPQTP